MAVLDQITTLMKSYILESKFPKFKIAPVALAGRFSENQAWVFISNEFPSFPTFKLDFYGR